MVLVIISIDIAGRLRRQSLHLRVLPRHYYIDLIITIEVIFCCARIHVVRCVAVVAGLARGAVIPHRLGFRQIVFITALRVTFKVSICSIHDFPLVGFDYVASHRVGHDRLSLLHLVRGVHELLYGFERQRLSLDTRLAG